jgi:predicted neuraminidase
MTKHIALLLTIPLLAAADDPGPAEDGKYRPSALAGVEEAYLPKTFPSSHAANLLQLKNGDLLCAWFSGSWEGDSDVAIVLARLPKGSSQWTKPIVVDHHTGQSYQNPVLFQAPGGTVWIFHTTQGAGAGESNAKVLVTISSDDGRHWTPETVLFDTPGAFTRDRVVVMPDGRWMLPMYTSADNSSAVRISSDGGANWKNCPIPESKGYVQPDVVLVNSEYVAWLRSRAADFIYRSTSPDGCTWTAPRKTELPNNNASVQLEKLANGHLVLAFNNKSKGGPRRPLSVALSKDGGATWGWVRDLETGRAVLEPGKDPNRKEPGREEYSYPSVLQTADGKINVAYTWRRETIKVVRFDEKWIETGGTTGEYQPHR